MNIVFRHVLTAVLFSVLLSLMVIGVTFLFYPLDSWTLLLDQEIGNVSYLIWIACTVLTIGIIVGVIVGLYWKQRIDHLDRVLVEMVKGQKPAANDENYKELDGILVRMKQLQEKIDMQAEYSQRLATERTEERERSLQEIVEQERNRLARELHDSVSQQLFAASMTVSALNEGNSAYEEPLKKQLGLVERMIHQSQLEMRALLLHLRPVALKGKSVQEGIGELLQELTEKVPMEVTKKLEEFPVDKGVEDQLFRILQESLSNTLRHADASTLQVILIERDGIIILRVVDNGVGFDMEKMKTSSYGLENMRERAYEIGGTFKIVSLPNQGTQLEVKVPVIRNGGEGND